MALNKIPPRTMLREAAFSAAVRLGLADLYERLKGLRRKVVSFHGVLNENEFVDGFANRVDLNKSEFESQIDFLINNYNVLPADAINDLSAEGVILTFDDGLQNNYDNVLPILQRYGLTGVFAVCPGLVEGDFPHLWNDHLFLFLKSREGSGVRLPMDDFATERRIDAGDSSRYLRELTRWIYRRGERDLYALVKTICSRNGAEYERMPMSPARFRPIGRRDLESMLQAGHAIVSHTWSHRPLKLLSRKEKVTELSRAREYVSGLTRAPAETIVYPFGRPIDVDGEAVAVARDLDYRQGYMNVSWPVDFSCELAQPRLSLTSSTKESVLRCRISGFSSFITMDKWRKGRHYRDVMAAP